MLKKHKVPCPNCEAYKIWSWSPAGLAFTLFLGSIITACVPIIGWILIVPLALLDILLLPITIVLFLIPKMRTVTAYCRQCEWRGSPKLLSSLRPIHA
jgi:hypothetical protein